MKKYIIFNFNHRIVKDLYKNNNIKENIDEEEPKIQEEVKPIEASSSHNSEYHKSEENLNSQVKAVSQKETEAPKQTADVNT